VSESSLHRDIIPLETALHRYAEQIASRIEGQTTGIFTGFKTLDAKTGGLQQSDLIIVAGRPGLGKTSLALNFVEHAAIALGKTCAVFSLEMSEMQLVQRLISMTAEIDGNRMRRGRLSIDEHLNYLLLRRIREPLTRLSRGLEYQTWRGTFGTGRAHSATRVAKCSWATPRTTLTNMRRLERSSWKQVDGWYLVLWGSLQSV